ncbi:unnamed protein product [Mycena citricolor]|uniref:BHLH domain-containing protein n=1 Tax=Mycena citricolor TaxID=2018698 RepID=A0AAD2H0R6_9AGAR|nr:unnamed protein product [Mycena citricolor]
MWAWYKNTMGLSWRFFASLRISLSSTHHRVTAVDPSHPSSHFPSPCAAAAMAVETSRPYTSTLFNDQAPGHLSMDHPGVAPEAGGPLSPIDDLQHLCRPTSSHSSSSSPTSPAVTTSDMQKRDLGKQQSRFRLAPQNPPDRRATHNAVEKARRERLNDKFSTLASILPPLAGLSRPTRSQIVNSTIATVVATQRHRVRTAHVLRDLIVETESLRHEVNRWRSSAHIPPLAASIREVHMDVLLGIKEDDRLGNLDAVKIELEDDGSGDSVTSPEASPLHMAPPRHAHPNSHANQWYDMAADQQAPFHLAHHSSYRPSSAVADHRHMASSYPPGLPPIDTRRFRQEDDERAYAEDQFAFQSDAGMGGRPASGPHRRPMQARRLSNESVQTGARGGGGGGGVGYNLRR